MNHISKSDFDYSSSQLDPLNFLTLVDEHDGKSLPKTIVADGKQSLGMIARYHRLPIEQFLSMNSNLIGPDGGSICADTVMPAGTILIIALVDSDNLAEQDGSINFQQTRSARIPEIISLQNNAKVQNALDTAMSNWAERQAVQHKVGSAPPPLPSDSPLAQELREEWHLRQAYEVMEMAGNPPSNLALNTKWEQKYGGEPPLDVGQAQGQINLYTQKAHKRALNENFGLLGPAYYHIFDPTNQTSMLNLITAGGAGVVMPGTSRNTVVLNGKSYVTPFYQHVPGRNEQTIITTIEMVPGADNVYRMRYSMGDAHGQNAKPITEAKARAAFDGKATAHTGPMHAAPIRMDQQQNTQTQSIINIRGREYQIAETNANSGQFSISENGMPVITIQADNMDMARSRFVMQASQIQTVQDMILGYQEVGHLVVANRLQRQLDRGVVPSLIGLRPANVAAMEGAGYRPFDNQQGLDNLIGHFAKCEKDMQDFMLEYVDGYYDLSTVEGMALRQQIEAIGTLADAIILVNEFELSDNLILVIDDFATAQTQFEERADLMKGIVTHEDFVALKDKMDLAKSVLMSHSAKLANQHSENVRKLASGGIESSPYATSYAGLMIMPNAVNRSHPLHLHLPAGTEITQNLGVFGEFNSGAYGAYTSIEEALDFVPLSTSELAELSNYKLVVKNKKIMQNLEDFYPLGQDYFPDLLFNMTGRYVIDPKEIKAMLKMEATSINIFKSGDDFAGGDGPQYTIMMTGWNTEGYEVTYRLGAGINPDKQEFNLRTFEEIRFERF